MTAKKPFTDAATQSWEVRAFTGNSNVQRLLRGQFKAADIEEREYLQACNDYILEYVRRSEALPTEEHLKTRNIRYGDHNSTIGNLLTSMTYVRDVEIEDEEDAVEFGAQLVDGLLEIAATMQESKSVLFVRSMLKEIFDERVNGILGTSDIDTDVQVSSLIKYVTAQDLQELANQKLLAHVATLRNKPAAKPSAPSL